MTDATITSPAAKPQPKTDRRRIASRNMIDASGNVTKDIMAATGAQYIYRPTGSKVERQFGSPGPETACAIFGYLTKIGNVVNSIVNADDYDGEADPVSQAQTWDADLGKGIWREKAEGVGRTSKFDKDLLAMVLIDKLGANAKGDVQHYRERLDDRSYFGKVRNNPELMAAYYEAVGKEADSMDSLA